MRKAGFLAFLLASSLGLAQGVVFLSTQLRPIEEAQKMRQVILKGFSGQVQFDELHGDAAAVRAAPVVMLEPGAGNGRLARVGVRFNGQ